MKKLTYTSPNGYTGVLYGKSSMAITDKNGREVFHTGFRNCETIEELKEQVDTFPEFMKVLIQGTEAAYDDHTVSGMLDD